MSWTDFVKVAEELYAILDSKSTEQVDVVVVNAVVQQLREAVSRPSDDPAACVPYIHSRKYVPFLLGDRL